MSLDSLKSNCKDKYIVQSKESNFKNVQSDQIITSFLQKIL